jgi:23S rRNA (guanosine2251-2'-O)-methyltransferase
MGKAPRQRDHDRRRSPQHARVAGSSTPPRRSQPGAAKGLWLYGRHAVEAALANPRRSCHRLLATDDALSRLGAFAKRAGVEVNVVDRAAIDRLLGEGTVHQGLALSAAPLPAFDLRRTCALEPGRNVVLVLDQINDPHNLGAILRSAAAFDVRAVVLPERRSAELGGVVAKAASGALDLVPVVEVVNLAQALEELAALGYWRIALDATATATPDKVPAANDLALVLGAEGSGLRRLVRERCDVAVRLPTAPQMASLNVSVACGIALYALARRPTSA